MSVAVRCIEAVAAVWDCGGAAAARQRDPAPGTAARCGGGGPGRPEHAIQRASSWRTLDQMGVSEPMPFGVLIDVQLPAATYFQALP